MKILVLNCGSSTIKCRLYEMPDAVVLARLVVEHIGEPRATVIHGFDGRLEYRDLQIANHGKGIDLILRSLAGRSRVLADLSEIDAVGHRVVHGGEAFTAAVPITEAVVEVISRYADLAPLHNPPNLSGIRAAQRALPGVPQVACFDTAFHSTLPPVAYLYALPYALYEDHGIRRYGFHGTSHEYVARRAAEWMERPFDRFNCITCHLGNGCSVAAIRHGRSVDTSMGLTPLEGLVMGTRTGDVDPAVLLYLADHGYDASALNDLCNKESGLLGISGTSNDMRMLETRAADGDERSRLAIDIFIYRLKKYIGAYTAVLGQVDAIVFTGGIGEHAVGVRAGSCEGLERLGIVLDRVRNEQAIGEGIISAPESRIQLLVIPTDEERAIAEATYLNCHGASVAKFL
jgi:acetate kinase